jgi:signal transduction histidine kinase
MPYNLPIFLKRYGIAVVFIVGVTALKLALSHVESQPVALFGVAVAVVAWRGGVGPGILASILSALAVDYFFLDPQGWSLVENIDIFGLYLLEACGVAVVVGKLRTEYDRASVRALHSERLYDEARLANKAKDVLLSEISHELRSPIHSMKLCLSMLQAVGEDRAKLQAILERMNRSTQLQARLVEDLLDFSRMQSGKFSLNLTLLSLCPLIQGCVESASSRAKARRLTFNFDSNGCDIRVDGDAARLEQVFTNILENAIKFTSDGGAVYVSVRSTATHARVDVRDTGIGLAPENLKSIFERFQQVHVAAYGGLGLGLSIAKDIIELHHGTITVHSEGLGMGTSFSVALPVHVPALAGSH